MRELPKMRTISVKGVYCIRPTARSQCLGQSIGLADLLVIFLTHYKDHVRSCPDVKGNKEGLIYQISYREQGWGIKHTEAALYLVISQRTVSDCSTSTQCQSLLNRLPLELRLDIYRLDLSAVSEINNESLVTTIAQHKARREAHQHTHITKMATLRTPILPKTS